MVHRTHFFDRRIAALVVAILTMGLLVAPALADINDVTPSTNDTNRTNGWAHVDATAGYGEAELEFVSERNFASCFEYRADGDESQKVADDNFNPDITDGLYPYVCVTNTTAVRTVEANEYVEVRLVFGAELDERFDWTRFEVLPDASDKDDCSDGGWETFGFANQGQCTRFVNGGGDSRP